MPAGKADKFILMEYQDFITLNIKVDNVELIESKVHNTKNLILHMSDYYIKDVRKGEVVELIMKDNKYFLMSLQRFKEVI